MDKFDDKFNDKFNDKKILIPNFFKSKDISKIH
jgi:hypothetical protein